MGTRYFVRYGRYASLTHEPKSEHFPYCLHIVDCKRSNHGFAEYPEFESKSFAVCSFKTYKAAVAALYHFGLDWKEVDTEKQIYLMLDFMEREKSWEAYERAFDDLEEERFYDDWS